ncbi:MAG: DUF3276 family protein [Bacteroidetes bacterium]|uniref:DUF3276 family protein n=1 Tax=Candidatus Cryptobacteroides faecavium TaxID=2840762 RepID=A0A9D9IHU3_9BACT|nr:DUF3276 family protein [Candidatus Cryptobacteroides faecavium]
MYSEEFDEVNAQERSGEDVYSKPVRAGKRTYFFDVKTTKGNDYYLTITESKRKVEKDGHFAYDKHKIFLYKEDFDKFAEGLQDAIEFIRENCLSEDSPAEKKTGSDKDAGDSFSNVSFEEL